MISQKYIYKVCMNIRGHILLWSVATTFLKSNKIELNDKSQVDIELPFDTIKLTFAAIGCHSLL